MTGPSVKQPDDMTLSDVWALVPARGGSRGVPGKNLRMLGSKPLIEHVLDMLAGILPGERIVVSTESDEIARACAGKAVIHSRPPRLSTPEATLDEVALFVAEWLVSERDADGDELLLTIQPTSPFLSPGTVRGCVEKLRGGARTVLTVCDDRHLRWTVGRNGVPQPLYEERANRQQLSPTWAETGGVIGARIGDVLSSGSRIGEPTALVEVSRDEALDIDTHQDWALAEFQLSRRSIVIRADGGRTRGLGHVHRALALAYELSSHRLLLATRDDDEFQLGFELLSRAPYPVRVVDGEAGFLDLLEEMQPDMTVLDVLDTEEAYTRRIADRTGFLVSIEDLGPGSRLADIVINDLYTDIYPQENHWYGVEHAILGRSFDRLGPPGAGAASIAPDRDGEVRRIMVSFGGTDERNLTQRTLEALRELEFDGSVVVVLGPGYGHGPVDLGTYGLRGDVLRDVRDMASVMTEADLAISSAGRTVTELMVAGVPTLVMCQNMRELRHTHASGPFGVMNLGLGEHVGVTTLTEHIRLLVDDAELRRDMRRRAARAVQGRSNATICRQIVERMETKRARQGQR